jgi:hypothetical protein
MRALVEEKNPIMSYRGRPNNGGEPLYSNPIMSYRGRPNNGGEPPYSNPIM